MLVLMTFLVGTAVASGPDTLWVRTIDVGGDATGEGITSRGDVIAVAGNAWTSVFSDLVALRLNQNGDTLWFRRYSAGGNECGSSAYLDAQLNVFVAGYSSIISAHSGRSRFHTCSQPLGLHSCALVVKYDSSGALQWVDSVPGDMAFGITADSADDCYVWGTHYVSDTTSDLWLGKLAPNGETLWTKTYHVAPRACGMLLASNSSGEIVGCAQAASSANSDCMTLRFTPDGDTIWTRRYDYSINDQCWGVALDPSGNVVVSGSVANDTAKGLVLKYDSSGTLLWSKLFGLDMDVKLGGAACDSAGNIYVSGYAGPDTNCSCLLMKLDSAGGKLWSATYRGSLGVNSATDVACDDSGNPIITGCVTNPLGYDDFLVSKYSSLAGISQSHVDEPSRARTMTTITALPEFVLWVPNSAFYSVKLCDVTGRMLRQLYRGGLSQGPHRLSLGGTRAGSYFVRVTSPSAAVSFQRLVLVK
ncbi:MAG TPA: hypothetical protein VMH22_13065 [bacterium]|nr:hypothetical protein [bacterium]